MNMKTIEGVTFEGMPRGTQRGFLNPFEIDIWQIYGRGWRFTLHNSQTGLFVAGGPNRIDDGYSTFPIAAQNAIATARNIIHPIETT